MKLTIVGSGTAAPTPERVCSGYWVEEGDDRLLLDCGPGVVHRMAELGLPWSDLDHVLVTHFHTDHTGDIPMLLFALKWGVRKGREKALTLWAPHGIGERIRAMEAAFGDHVADPGFPLILREVRPGERFPVGSVLADVCDTPHTPESLAYRLEGSGTLGYTGDTGPSPDVAAFMKGVDVLVAECSLPDDDAIDTHLSPTPLADMATRAEPGRLVITHVYPRLEALDPVARVAEAGWGGETAWAEDGLTLAVGG